MADTRTNTLAAARASPIGRGQPVDDGCAAASLVFERIVAEQQERVTRLCRRLLGWDDDIEEAVQEVFLKTLVHLPRFRGESNISTWLTRIAVNTCRSVIRRRRVRLRWLSGAGRHAPAKPVPADGPGGLIDAEQNARVRAAVAALPPKYREVTVLRYLEELEVPEIARILEIRRNAVEVRLNRARKRLRESLAGIVEV